MRVEAARQLEAGVEAVLPEPVEARPPEIGATVLAVTAVAGAKIQACWHHLYVPLPQRVVYHVLILLHLPRMHDPAGAQREMQRGHTHRRKSLIGDRGGEGMQG